MKIPLLVLLPLTIATLAATGNAHSDEIPIGVAKNYRFMASATEPRPKQYQIYIKWEQSNLDRSCALFTAHVRTIDRREIISGPRESVASFLLMPTDFPVDVWLDDVRVESWGAWYQKNQAQGRQGYGNPCLEAQSVAVTTPVRVELPANPNMPCDSQPTSDANGPAAQHIAVANGSLRIEITRPDSNLNYVIAFTDIDQGSFSFGTGTRPELDFVVKAAQIESFDNKGDRFVGPLPNQQTMHLTCSSQQDASSLMGLLRTGP
jgi:hypothetical protein